MSLSLIKFKRVFIPSHREAGQATPLRLNRFWTDRVGGANGRKWRGVVVGGVTCTLFRGATDFSMILQEKKKTNKLIFIKKKKTKTKGKFAWFPTWRLKLWKKKRIRIWYALRIELFSIVVYCHVAHNFNLISLCVVCVNSIFRFGNCFNKTKTHKRLTRELLQTNEINKIVEKEEGGAYLLSTHH